MTSFHSTRKVSRVCRFGRTRLGQHGFHSTRKVSRNPSSMSIATEKPCFHSTRKVSRRAIFFLLWATNWVSIPLGRFQGLRVSGAASVGHCFHSTRKVSRPFQGRFFGAGETGFHSTRKVSRLIVTPRPSGRSGVSIPLGRFQGRVRTGCMPVLTCFHSTRKVSRPVMKPKSRADRGFPFH